MFKFYEPPPSNNLQQPNWHAKLKHNAARRVLVTFIAVLLAGPLTSKPAKAWWWLFGRAALPAVGRAVVGRTVVSSVARAGVSRAVGGAARRGARSIRSQRLVLPRVARPYNRRHERRTNFGINRAAPAYAARFATPRFRGGFRRLARYGRLADNARGYYERGAEWFGENRYIGAYDPGYGRDEEFRFQYVPRSYRYEPVRSHRHGHSGYRANYVADCLPHW